MTTTLIADDLKYWHKIVRGNLVYFGFNDILHAYTVGEGLSLYTREKPGLNFIDINFDTDKPGNILEGTGNLDGLVLCKQIRGLNENTKIIVMSSIEDGAKESAMECGADYFIQKRNLKDEIEDFIK